MATEQIGGCLLEGKSLRGNLKVGGILAKVRLGVFMEDRTRTYMPEVRDEELDQTENGGFAPNWLSRILAKTGLGRLSRTGATLGLVEKKT